MGIKQKILLAFPGDKKLYAKVYKLHFYDYCMTLYQEGCGPIRSVEVEAQDFAAGMASKATEIDSIKRYIMEFTRSNRPPQLQRELNQ